LLNIVIGFELYVGVPVRAVLKHETPLINILSVDVMYDAATCTHVFKGTVELDRNGLPVIPVIATRR
jgi:hypothetical protein